MKKGLLSTDWFAGLLITFAVLILVVLGMFSGIERAAYDWGVRSSDSPANDKVAVIAIDDESIDRIGRWPWSRSTHAALLNKLKTANPKVVGYTVFFLEPQIDPGLAYIQDILAYTEDSQLLDLPDEVLTIDSMLAKNRDEALRKYFAESALFNSMSNDVDELYLRLQEAQLALNTDSILAGTMADVNNVVLSMPFLVGLPQGNPDFDLPDFVLANSISNVDVSAGTSYLPLPTYKAFSPIPGIGDAAIGIGHLNAWADVDGAIRTEPLVLQYYDSFFPSMSLMLAAKSLNLSVDDIKIRLGEGVTLGRLNIATEPDLQMRTFYYADKADGSSAFTVDSFYDVMEGKVNLDKYQDKIVLVGATATGVGAPQVTPLSPSMAPVLSLAHSVSSILNEDFFIQPSWAIWVQLLVFIIMAAYIMFLLPRISATTGALITGGLVLTLIIVHYILMVSQGMWIQLMTPVMLLIIGYVGLTLKGYVITERGKQKSDADSAESNRMLGLAFQGQGQLDMAFEKFRKVPLDNSVMELLYNLSLDYERKRQFNKANSVYSYMFEFDPKFRDLETRMKRADQMEQTVMLGGAGGSTAGGTMIMEGDGVQKPMLGRYEVQKELGKGAMGVVYLGEDPKISRTVAIKTMALSQEFEDDELEEVKERFFREAETAGRLNHPNIVTIFDAGEEQDLAYIAMEFLKGKDLAPNTKKDHLLPARTVLELIAQCADALNYAHSQNVVHRDIKPANIMYDPESGQMKVTDFGIARITDSSKTKTGMVLGTPSYMSPEQLAGHKVDGRSDLFSLGVMLYQMVSGQLPFTGDSMATLMFKIANEQHQPIEEVVPDLAPCIGAIIDQAMSKDIEARYQNGAEMAADIRTCLQMMPAE